nr:integrase, catalytic region, zinc finger, CCHC-type, peptidase aspartic, catalytic [Tanacetum cinerariifolium]
MRGSKYGDQDRKAAILYEYETFKATEGEQLLDTYLRYLQVINDLKKCGYKKYNCELNYKFLNNVQPEWKQYGTLIRQTKNLMDINIDALYNILKQNQGDVNDALGHKNKAVVITSDPLALSANKKQEFVKSDDKKEDKKADEKKRDMSKVKYESSSSAEETIAEVAYYTSESESESEFETSEYYDDSTNYGLFVNNDDDQEIFHDAIESASKNFIENHIDSQKDYDKSKVDHNDSEEKEHLVDNLIRKFNHKIAKCFKNPRYFEKTKDLRPNLYDEKVIGLGYTPMFLTHFDEALEIEKFKRSRENKIEFVYDYGNLYASYVNEKINFSDDYFQEIINPYFDKIDSPFQQTSSLKPYVSNVILENIIIDLEDEFVSLLEKEKANLETIESLKSKSFESSENAISESENQSENNCQVVAKDCDNMKNPKVIAPGMFKLSVSQSVSPISMSKTSFDSNNVEIKLKRKRHKRKSSKQNDQQVNNDVSRANSDFDHFSDLDTFSCVRRPKHSGVIWKKKGLSNTSNVDLSFVNHLQVNKDVKRYSRKNLLSGNNFHLGETSSASVCNDAMNVSCNSRMCDEFDDNNFFIFDDESIVQICLWIIDSGCSKHMTENRALLTNFVEKFLLTVRFGNSDFAVIAGY